MRRCWFCAGELGQPAPKFARAGRVFDQLPANVRYEMIVETQPVNVYVALRGTVRRIEAHAHLVCYRQHMERMTEGRNGSG